MLKVLVFNVNHLFYKFFIFQQIWLKFGKKNRLILCFGKEWCKVEGIVENFFLTLYPYLTWAFFEPSVMRGGGGGEEA